MGMALLSALRHRPTFVICESQMLFDYLDSYPLWTKIPCETMKSFSHLNINVMNLLFMYFLKPSLTGQKDRGEILRHCQMPSKFRL